MERSSGILLHISSLPNRHGIGTMGPEAYEFIDFLQETKQKIWQILPLGPTGYGNSPYQSYSVFAGNALLISLDKLQDEGLIREDDLKEMAEVKSKKVDYELIREKKMTLLRKALVVFRSGQERWEDAYRAFRKEHGWWLDDYCLFQAIKNQDQERCWNEWKKGLKFRNQQALDAASQTWAEEIEFQCFIQFMFFRQWFGLKKYANDRGIRILGDLPLYISMDSADVWSNPDIFLLDEERQMQFSGGVPPDLFSETGQFWGCPVYDWKRLAEREFDWWLARFHFNLHLFDLVRIDHFRGLESFWSIPAGEETAVNGNWIPAGGYALLKKLKEQIGELPLIAEDLGVITPEVEKLRDDFGLPGMKVLQFAYGTDETNGYLPHNYGQNFVVYTGTHDNNTTVGWVKSASRRERRNLMKYFDAGWKYVHRSLMEAALASVAGMAVIPMQDLLELDGRSRMNKPGTIEGNWEWKFEWRMLKRRQKNLLKKMTKKYNRAG
ncbi:MAG: 4-alpha-glucanotransferase [Mangrovibacterium sp.]